MATKYTNRLPPSAWPVIDTGQRTDRGWQHTLSLARAKRTFEGDDSLEFQLRTPSKESLVLVWLRHYATSVDSADDGWKNLTIADYPQFHQRAEINGEGEPSGEPWAYVETRERELLAETEDNPVWLPNLKTAVFGERSDIRVLFDTPVNGSNGWVTELELVVVRIPYSQPRIWSRGDMIRALESIDELSRRVT